MKVKFDTAKIPGFENLTEEQKQAIAGYELDVPEPDMSGYVKKDVFDKKASEAADLAKQLKSKMSEAEIAEASRNEEFESMKTELNSLRRDKTVSAYKAKYLELGYDAELAGATAIAMADGKTDVVFENQKIFNEMQKKNIESAALGRQPGLSTGTTPTAQNAEQQLTSDLRRYAGL